MIPEIPLTNKKNLMVVACDPGIGFIQPIGGPDWALDFEFTHYLANTSYSFSPRNDQVTLNVDTHIEPCFLA